MRQLLHAHKYADASHIELRVTCSGSLLRLMQLTGLDNLLHLCADYGAALTSLRPVASQDDPGTRGSPGRAASAIGH